MPKKYKRNCNHCKKYYEGGGASYCSIACRTACSDWQVNIAKNPKRFVKGQPSPWKGRNRPLHPNSREALRRYYETHQVWNKGTSGVMKRNSGTFTSERVRGPNNWRWKGGISDENTRIRHSPEYKEWRMKVYQRDHFTCVLCGYRSKKPRDIRADHIKPFSLYRELRFDVDNGRTLCLPCDLKHGWNSLREMNQEINYGTWRFYYEIRKPLRELIFQVLAPPRQ